MTDRKKSGVAFCATVVVVVVLTLYPLSLGPFFWLDASGKLPGSLIWANHLYDPLRWIIKLSPDAERATSDYLSLWMPAVPLEYHGE